MKISKKEYYCICINQETPIDIKILKEIPIYNFRDYRRDNLNTFLFLTNRKNEFNDRIKNLYNEIISKIFKQIK